MSKGFMGDQLMILYWQSSDPVKETELYICNEGNRYMWKRNLRTGKHAMYSCTADWTPRYLTQLTKNTVFDRRPKAYASHNRPAINHPRPSFRGLYTPTKETRASGNRIVIFAETKPSARATCLHPPSGDRAIKKLVGYVSE